MGIFTTRNDVIDLLVQISIDMFNLQKQEGNANFIASQILKDGNDTTAITFILLCKKEGWLEPLEIASKRNPKSNEVFVHLHETLAEMGKNNTDFMTSIAKKKMAAPNSADKLPDKSAGVLHRH